ncbi:ABC transporter ATP-binding protein [Sphaerisporangium sp. NPDC051011]|uniref:ABC transporter ATP-binding protein n=1 Tax=Sphaerisporangium sp. NPDC051011 TaxID=3155792 RepID=UPI0033FD1894
MTEPLFEVEDLTMTLRAGHGKTILRSVSVGASAGEAIGLIGESGAGKSTTARALLGMTPPEAAVHGTVRVLGTDVLSLRRSRLQRFRAENVALIAQDPRASVNPMHGIEVFLTEAMRANRNLSKAEARRRAAEALEQVGLDPEKVLRSYPHEVSGGMLQRVVIAAAVAVEPRLLIADEPSTALDVTSQATVISLLRRVARRTGAGLVLVTHNIEVAASVCDRLVVMRAGSVVETGTTDQVLHRPLAEYTRALIEATRAVSGATDRDDFPGNATESAHA